MYSRHVRFRPRVLALLLIGTVVVGSILIISTLTAKSAAAASQASPHVDVMVLNTEIGPASLRFLTRAISTAESDGAVALVIKIDTPGGDLESMKAMTQAELSSTVPIIAYVSPTGGRAASAGAFVTLAAHVAVMAPTTRIGASSPVDGTGGDIGSTLKSKLEQDLLASLNGIQSRYHRSFAPAALMVTQATSYSDADAESLHIVDCAASYTDKQAEDQHITTCPGATDLTDLLNKIDGRSVTLYSGQSLTLHTAGVSVQNIDASLFEQLYGLLIDPNVVFILFIIAVVGIYVEISHPGIILPGVTGAIALLLFLLAVGSLSPNWTGLALMVLAFVLLVLDLRLPTHGVLTVGALISLIVGALLFFNSGGPYSGPQVNPVVVYSLAGVLGLMSLYLIRVIMSTRRQPVTTGTEGMIGARVIALTPLSPQGRVDYGGENWAAVIDAPATSLDAGSEAQIVSVEGLSLRVRPIRSLPDVSSLRSLPLESETLPYSSPESEYVQGS